MFERIGGRDRPHLIQTESTEGSSRSREQDLLDLAFVFAHEGLEDRAMFAVHRQDRGMMADRQVADDLSRDDQRLFVRQRDGLTGFDRFDGRFESGISDHRRHHDVDAWHRHDLRDGFRPCPHFDRHIRQSLTQRFVEALIGNADHFGFELPRLCDESVNAPVRAKGIDAVPVGISAHDIQSLRSDRARGAQYT